MKHVLWAGAASLALVACGDAEPVGQGTVKPEVVETLDPVEPVSEIGDGESVMGEEMRWAVTDDGTQALYGPPRSAAIIELRCEKTELRDNRLVLNWNIDASKGGTGAVTMGWGREIEILEVNAAENAEMPSGYSWSATFVPTGVAANFLLSATLPITFRIAATTDAALTVPSEGGFKRVIQSCQMKE